jgi:mannose-6-phosphate isomerase-like protein (cupin superfamily)
MNYMMSSPQLPEWDVPLLHCLSAGWATADDMDFVLPILGAVENMRQSCYLWLAEQFVRIKQPDHVITDALAQAHKLGGFADMLQLWQAEPAAVPALPTFALYFVGQSDMACQAHGIGPALAFMSVLESAAAPTRDALRRAHNKKLQLPKQPSDDEAPNQAAIQSLCDILAAAFGIGKADEATHANAAALFARFFEDLYEAMRNQRLASLCAKIQGKRSLQDAAHPVLALSAECGGAMREERDDKRNQQFSVTRLPCEAEALDPRVVRIAPGKFNNLHKHAHETFFCLLQGSGQILVGDDWVQVKAGESVFAPRWAMHQTHNTGDCDLVMLAITDFYLSNKVFVGKNSTTVL